MIKTENVEVFNFKGAIRGLRNPMNSWAKSDSFYCYEQECISCPYVELWGEQGTICKSPIVQSCVKVHGKDEYTIGPKDIDLCQRMIKAGASDGKFMRQIFVCMDITAPLYWWKEADQYRIGCTTNSCSTMHKITSRDLTRDDFSCEHMDAESLELLDKTIELFNRKRAQYLEAPNDEKKDIWWQLIQDLPSSFNQKRTWTGSYENLRNMYFQRRYHKLDEWREFCKTLETLPYAKELVCYEPTKENE